MILKTLFEHALSDEIDGKEFIDKTSAEKLFIFFKACKTFRWHDVNNDCEDRANAICLLLDDWNITNAKAWVFSGYVFNKIGYLKNLWKYHVAAAIPVMQDGVLAYFIIDPATSGHLTLLADWAANVTDNPHSYHLVKNGKYYIFNDKKIKKNNWYKRNKGNYNWTMQGLSGINGISNIGKAQLAFLKSKVVKTKKDFAKLRYLNPLV
ncbi:MAG: protein-glutamine glutaminase family protein [Ginsengibacter sp.]